MEPKTILLGLNAADHAAAVTRVGADLARRFGAHLVGLHAIEALIVYPGIAMHVPGPVYAQFNASQKAEAAAIEETFQKLAGREDFVAEWRLVRTESITAADRLVESSRGADLVVLSQARPDTDMVNQGLVQERVVRESGRPVLLVPLEYSGTVEGRRILIGWSATREAARAAHDVLDLAAPGAEVCLLRVGQPSDELHDDGVNQVAQMLGRHGMRVEVKHRGRAGQSIAEVLLHEAREIGADLIASGAFGHSRSYDFVIGAATRELMRATDLPVLFSK
ncbi:universal stress protein [Rhodobacteraceae bacterium CCMM004]|nr:universal stress protein [Rhodobacteraceae bacterium CCMM004]